MALSQNVLEKIAKNREFIYTADGQTMSLLPEVPASYIKGVFNGTNIQVDGSEKDLSNGGILNLPKAQKNAVFDRWDVYSPGVVGTLTPIDGANKAYLTSAKKDGDYWYPRVRWIVPNDLKSVKMSGTIRIDVLTGSARFKDYFYGTPSQIKIQDLSIENMVLNAGESKVLTIDSYHSYQEQSDYHSFGVSFIGNANDFTANITVDLYEDGVSYTPEDGDPRSPQRCAIGDDGIPLQNNLTKWRGKDYAVTDIKPTGNAQTVIANLNLGDADDIKYAMGTTETGAALHFEKNIGNQYVVSYGDTTHTFSAMADGEMHEFIIDYDGQGLVEYLFDGASDGTETSVSVGVPSLPLEFGRENGTDTYAMTIGKVVTYD